ncbi:phage terminase small subunit [Shouchella miscanthi]|uniref:phage terminase small subunit n=1 Tax=Shouchella miscanthi TaxID=2598861 RepID=UPI00119CE88E|nr:phage terminase small subunit [Shouchella miscanthi]
MARQRDPRRDEAYEIWKETKKPLKEIAEELGCSPSQIRKWKSHDEWERNGNVTNGKGSVTKKSAPDKSRKKQQNRSGNPNPQNQFTERNSAALKHGLFSRYMPKETLEIIGMLEDANPVDLLWDQIQIQYAAILRSQKIMWVNDANDSTRALTKVKGGLKVDSEGNLVKVAFAEELQYDNQYAWDKQANFLSAQSRAIAELRSSIKQFNDMAHEDDTRRLKLEQLQLNVNKTKAEVSLLSNDEEEYEDDGFMDAIKGASEQVWNDEEA